MPELPEVENVKLKLEKALIGSQVVRIEYFRPDLRFALPKDMIKKISNQKVVQIQRRAKYLVFRFEDNSVMLSHLGMTGSWLWGKDLSMLNHDHVRIHFNNGILTYNDPRRFGYIKYFADGYIKDFEHLGIEPLDSELDEKYLFENAKNKVKSIKSYIMDQKIVVGIGNIYACEALFLAKLSPHRKIQKVKLEEWKVFLREVRKVLKKAIQKGGSTIKDYRQSDGSAGEFQKLHLVYGKANGLCPNCNNLIRNDKILGRSTFWCKKCQS